VDVFHAVPGVLAKRPALFAGAGGEEVEDQFPGQASMVGRSSPEVIRDSSSVVLPLRAPPRAD